MLSILGFYATILVFKLEIYMLQTKTVEILELIEKWQQYLKLQHNCSEHTIVSYNNDLSNFLDFINQYTDKIDRNC